MARKLTASARSATHSEADAQAEKTQRTSVPTTTKTIPEQVRMVRNHKLSRRKLLVGLGALGVTAGAAATIAAATRRPAASHPTQNQGQHFQQHDKHITTQVRGDIAG